MKVGSTDAFRGLKTPVARIEADARILSSRIVRRDSTAGDDLSRCASPSAELAEGDGRIRTTGMFVEVDGEQGVRAA